MDKTYVTAFLGSLAISLALTPLARALAFRFQIISSPGGRHIHAQAIPRLGGLSIYGSALFISLGLLTWGSLSKVFETEVGSLRGWGILLGSTLMFAIGLADDIKGVRARHKLAVQGIAAVLAWYLGFRIDVIDLPFVSTFSLGLLSLPITVLWIVGIINAINLIDGLDGLAAGVVFFAAITNFVVAYLMGTTLVAFVMATLAGAVLGFLFFNFNPARIFMGDSGSYFLGYVLAVCSIAGPLQKASAAVSISVPVAALGVPIIDTLLAMVRRFLEKRPLFSPDRGHIHHRLLDMGITHRRAVLIIYGVTVMLCVCAISIALGRNWQVGVAVLGISAVLFGLIRFIGYFEYLKNAARQKNRIRSRHVEWLRRTIPSYLRKTDGARDVAALFASLQFLASQSKFDTIEVRNDAGDILHRFAGDDYQDMDVRDSCVSETSLEPFGLRLHFLWRSEFGDVAPEMELLLQLAGDFFCEAYGRLEPHAAGVAASGSAESSIANSNDCSRQAEPGCSAARASSVPASTP
jgi:UDP-GlcNAc:undecaprenyl-phosphate/decaprenyl-phosphate GlcNAc-1-phosphate transferase